MDSRCSEGASDGIPASSLRPGELFDLPVRRSAEIYGFGGLPPSIATWLVGHGFPKQGELKGIDRLGQAVHSANFVPHSKAEVDNMVLANKHVGDEGGFAKALNTVLLHNKDTGGRDPAKVLRLKVGQVGGYLENSGRTLAKLDNILEDLVRVSVKKDFMSKDQSGQEARTQWLREVFDISYNRSGLAAVIRMIKVKISLESGQMIDLDKEPAEELKWAEVEQLLSQLNPTEFLYILEQAVLSEISRQEFWLMRLEEAKAHGSVKAQVERLLQRLFPERQL